MQKPRKTLLGKCLRCKTTSILQYIEQPYKAKQQNLPRKQNKGQKSNIKIAPVLLRLAALWQVWKTNLEVILVMKLLEPLHSKFLQLHLYNTQVLVFRYTWLAALYFDLEPRTFVLLKRNFYIKLLFPMLKHNYIHEW